ncbi:MAG TPA: protein translocase subunit SecF [Tissierellaceae bacterium]|nr:protein translocase subunit SecF [Tissierellaceae bacterium]
MNIVEKRKIFIGISLSIIILGIIMFIINGFNYGIEFTGGTLIQVNSDEFIEAEKIRPITDEFDENISIVHGGEDKKELILRSTLDLSNADVNKMADDFEKEFGIKKSNFKSEKVGPSMGKEIKNKAVISITIATIAMLIYITFRFEFTFGLAAIIALIHDVLITLSMYAIFKLPVNNAFIAAILTIVGYSINDTIVIFDRIREEIRLNPREELDNIINSGISHTLRRTINTTITTVIAVSVLYIVGVEDIKVLALPLIFGLLAGTYSSTFIASPLWYIFKNFRSKTA